MMIKYVWVFNGADSNFPSGIFADRENAEKWIKKHKLTCTLTLYPINKGVYDWAIEEGIFNPSRDYQNTPAFIQKFSSASQEHYHYLEGGVES